MNQLIGSEDGYSTGYGSLIELYTSALISEALLDHNVKNWVVLNAPSRIDGHAVDVVVCRSSQDVTDLNTAEFCQIFPIQITRASRESKLFIRKKRQCHENHIAIISIKERLRDLVSLYFKSNGKERQACLQSFFDQITYQSKIIPYFMGFVENLDIDNMQKPPQSLEAKEPTNQSKKPVNHPPAHFAKYSKN